MADRERHARAAELPGASEDAEELEKTALPATSSAPS
jgi:hypothetical protein